jgi:hypothetical protein
MPAKIAAFDSDFECPKCDFYGSIDGASAGEITVAERIPNLIHCEGDIDGCPLRVAPPSEREEHLHVTCGICKYRWLMRCADFEENPE